MQETHRYLVGGVTLESDVCLPSLVELPAASAETPDLRLGRAPLEIGEDGPWLVERRLAEGDEPYLRVRRTPSGYLLAHVSGPLLAIEGGGHRLLLDTTAASLSASDLEHLLLDQLLPLVIARLGRISLHASAVARGDRAVAFLAPSGTGKSTTAAALGRRPGISFLADDQVVLEPVHEGFLAHPSYPSVRLWGDSARAIFGGEARDERKERRAMATSASAVRLSAIALLEVGETSTFEALRPRDALVGIAPHVDRLDPTDREALRSELELMTKLARETPTLRIKVPRDLDALDASIDAILAALLPTGPSRG